MAIEIRDVAPGLWLWRQPHPDWDEDADWRPEVAFFAVESEGVSVLLDPLAPPPGAREVWERIEAMRPTVVAVLKPDHLRDVELFVRWYGARAFGPFLFWEGELRIWDAPGFESRVLPAFRRMLDLPFERVLVSHGEPWGA
jgi:hypothetical protein